MLDLLSNTLFIPYNRKRKYNNSIIYGKHSIKISALNIQNNKNCTELWLFAALCALSNIYTGKNGLSFDVYQNISDVHMHHIECYLDDTFYEFTEYFKEQIINKNYNNMEITQNEKHKTIFIMNFIDDNKLYRIINKYDLCFHVIPIKKSFIIKLWYNRSFYTESYIKDMMSFYRKMLIWFVQNPNESMKKFPGYGPVLKGPRISIPKIQLRDAINITCNRYPDKIACEDESGGISYRDLKIESDAIACWLIHNGVVEQTTVCLWMNKTKDYLIFLLAAIKAGCICLSLDVRISNQMAMKLIHQGNVNMLIVEEQSVCSNDFIVYTTKDIKKEAAKYINIDPTDMFATSCQHFLFYTSGSTGESKGVILNENGVKNHIYTKIDLLKLKPDDIIVHDISISFIASLWLFLAPLIVGAKIALISETLPLNVRMVKYLSYKVTILTAVPSVLRAILKIDSKKGILKKMNVFRWIVSTGEELDTDLVHDLFLNFPHIKIMNAYGQTECSDDTLHYILDRPIYSGFIPIGTPSMNTDVCIRDRHGILLPRGVVGEITITGPGVANKYLFEDLSSSMTVPEDVNIYGTYSSGDAGYINKSDQVVYIGRIHLDEKVNGNKIAIQQIQIILKKDRIVHDAAVYVHTDENGFKHTILFYVSDEEINSEYLKKRLCESLYWYMIPDRFIKVCSLPRNLNGKIDFPLLIEQYKKQVDDSYNYLLELLAGYDESGNNDFIMTGGNSLAFAILAAKMTQSDQTYRKILERINQTKNNKRNGGDKYDN